MSTMAPTSGSRIRRRPVIFGNPALGTYEGVIFTLEEREDIQGLMLPSSSETSVDTVAAMVNVPPEQVPEGVLHLAQAHRNQIEHVRILISPGAEETEDQPEEAAGSNEKKNDSFELASPTTPKSGNRDHSLLIDQQSLKSPSSSNYRMASPSVSSMENAAAIFAADKRPPDSENASVDAKYRQQLLMNPSERKERTYLLLFVLTSAEATKKFVEDLNQKPYTSLDETQVADVQYIVGLEGYNGVSLTSPVFCSAPSTLEVSSTKSSNASRASTDDTPEAHNCAVCLEPLEQEDDAGILTTVCNHSFHWACLWQCKDSPCPVCRYDHAGLNDCLSQCHVCGTTEDNYVCLICGVISCANAAVSVASSKQNQVLTKGHARQHYDETLHAYALDTETQHVWDFCGQGYVHRLLQNTSDGKLVEVSNQVYNQRLPEAGRLSDRQEDEVVHRKLEGFAGQYYTLLKSQLEQQRIHYEGRLGELLRSKDAPRPVPAGESLISALKQERHQLQQRLTTLQERHHKVADEVSFLKNLNESLETNKEQMKHQVQEARRERSEARDMIHQALPPLEEKVYHLMLQLECEDTKPAAR
jgi:BRCA1-associated protein